MQNVPKFAFDDATSLGWMRMFRIQEGEGLVRKIEEDREALRSTFFFFFLSFLYLHFRCIDIVYIFLL